MPLPENILEISQSHLQQLIADREPEGPHLDFKRELPPAWNDQAKHDLASDASAFANAGGGYLIYGLDQDDEGFAATLVPQNLNPDNDAMRMESILRDKVEPRMQGCRVLPIAVTVNDKTGFVVVVRVPQSWTRPHRVKSNQHFYLRAGKQSRPLDIPEIRSLFLRSESQAQRMQDFRTERIARILTAETPRPLAPGVVIVLHLIPTQAALGALQVDPLQYDTFRSRYARRLPLIGSSGGSPRITLEGMAHVRPLNAQNNKSYGYSLFFRNGFFEATTVYDGGNPQNRNLIPITHQQLEFNCLKVVDQFRSELHTLNANKELTVMLTILNANQGALAFNRMDFDLTTDEGLFDRQHVILPDVRLDEDTPTDKGMRPAFDLVWQSCGLAGSPNFDNHGQFKALHL